MGGVTTKTTTKRMEKVMKTRERERKICETMERKRWRTKPSYMRILLRTVPPHNAPHSPDPDSVAPPPHPVIPFTRETQRDPPCPHTERSKKGWN